VDHTLSLHDALPISVFHVSLLKPYHASGRVPPPPPRMLLTDDDGDIFEVEAILKHRERKFRNRERTQYRIKWKGYGDEHNTWEPAENLSGSAELVAKYWEALGLPQPME